MLAVSRTVKGDRMVAFEFLRIVERDGTLVYIAQPNGNPPTEFRLSAISRDSATFENKAHDFPKVIAYAKKPDGSLEARVTTRGQKAETFVFRPGSRRRIGGPKRPALTASAIGVVFRCLCVAPRPVPAGRRGALRRRARPAVPPAVETGPAIIRHAFRRDAAVGHQLRQVVGRVALFLEEE